MGHSSRVVAPLCAALALLGLACSQEVVRPHLFLITADALRADHTSLFGYPRRTTPNLDVFAGEAFRFRDFGVGAALAVVLLVTIVPLMLVSIRRFQFQEELR